MDGDAYRAALALTLLLELPFVVAAAPGDPWRSLAVGLGANLLTHGVLWTVFPWVPLPYAITVALLEAVVVVTEAIALARLAGWPARRAFLVSFVANATSTVVGLLASV